MYYLISRKDANDTWHDLKFLIFLHSLMWQANLTLKVGFKFLMTFQFRHFCWPMCYVETFSQIDILNVKIVFLVITHLGVVY